MVRNSTLALCVCVCALHPALVAAQAPDPNLVYHTLHTPHFDITYHDPLGELAQRLATAAEHVNSVLSRTLQFSSSERTQILLTDEADDANGIAGVVPRNEIHLLAAAPSDLSPLGDYDDWMTLLITHEYTHILHLDQIGGLGAVINAVLGKTVTFNALQPRWFIEGLATHEESAHTPGGRMRSSLYEMILRMDALSATMPSLAQLSNDANLWPHGDMRYLYGGRFLGFIARQFGEGALTAIGREYGRALLPYGLNRVARRVTGRDFVELYDQFRAELTAQYRAERAQLEAAGLIEGTALYPHSEYTRSPRYLGDGRVAFFADDGHTPAQLRTLDGQRLTETSGEAVFAPTPDGRSLVFSQSAPYRDIYSFSDLFRLDLQSGQTQRLTEGLRASQPDVAPSGRQVAFVTQDNGSTQLELAELADVPGTRRTLYRGGAFEQVFTPRFSPDGRTVAVSAWRQGGYRDLLLIGVADGSVHELMRDRAQDSGPTFAPDGRRLYFSSDRGGVPDIYAYELATGEISRVTRMLGGAFQPVVSPDGRQLVFVDYGSLGYGLRSLPLPAADDAPDPEPEYVDRRPARPAPRPAPSGRHMPVSAYSPLPTLLPNNYRLELGPGPLGAELAIAIEGADIAAFHNYAVRVSQTLERLEAPGMSISYVYTRSVLSPSLRVFRDLSTRSDFYVNGRSVPWTAISVGASAALAYRFEGVRRSQTLAFDYTVSHISQAAPFEADLDPNEPPPALPELGIVPRAGFGYRYSDTVRNPYDISPSEGRTFNLHLDVSDPIMGRDVRAVQVRWEIKQFIAMPWLQHHVLALRYAGGLAAGDAGEISRFSLGGFPDDAPFPSIYDVAIFGALPELGGVALRGYPPAYRSGTQFQHVQIEYRLPLFTVEWGIYTLPFYVRRVWMTLFADTGDAYSGNLEPSNLLFGAGAELFISFLLVYRVGLDLRIGLAHGFTHDGETQFYMHLGSPF